MFSGYASTGATYSQNLKVIEYEGEPHLSFWQGNDQSNGQRGYGVIMDNNYHPVQTVNSGLGRAPNDVHEFTILKAGTAIITIFQPAPYDLSSFGLIQPVGWVVEGIFQEIDIASGEVMFEWRSLDHIDPIESYNTYGSEGTSNGSTVADAWDYL